jgi:large subunit ribosomal protein L13
MTTTIVKEKDVRRSWYVVDAADKPAGRLAAGIANVLRGKLKPTYTLHVDDGDFVVVINAEKVKLTGTKEDTKIYKSFSGYPGGLKTLSARTVRARNPTRIIQQAVRGMLPKNKMNRLTVGRLKVYAGPNHPHTAQQPKPLDI